METTNTFLRLALTYLDRGWSIFPLQARTKIPFKSFPTKTYQRERRPTEQEIERWWGHYPRNLAVATGAISGIFVWDCDDSQAWGESARRGLPPTLTTRTDRGYHLYFQYPDFQIGNRAGLLPGVDVRGDGGYVVAPPSIHPSGWVYCWQNATAPILPAPGWMLDLLRSKPVAAPRSGNPTPAPRGSRYGIAALRSEAHEVSTAVANRNDRLYRAALKMGSLVAAGALEESTVISELFSAAKLSGYVADDGESQTYRTIQSGLKIGMENPRW